MDFFRRSSCLNALSSSGQHHGRLTAFLARLIWFACETDGSFSSQRPHGYQEQTKTCQAAFSLWLPFEPSRRNCTGRTRLCVMKGWNWHLKFSTSCNIICFEVRWFVFPGFLRWIFSRHSLWILLLLVMGILATPVKATLSRNTVLLWSNEHLKSWGWVKRWEIYGVSVFCSSPCSPKKPTKSREIEKGTKKVLEVSKKFVGSLYIIYYIYTYIFCIIFLHFCHFWLVQFEPPWSHLFGLVDFLGPGGEDLVSTIPGVLRIWWRPHPYGPRGGGFFDECGVRHLEWCCGRMLGGYVGDPYCK